MRRWRRLLAVACLIGLSTSAPPDQERWAKEIDDLVHGLASSVEANPARARARIDDLVRTVGQPALDRLEASIATWGGDDSLDEIVRRHGVTAIRWGTQPGASTSPPLLTANDKYVACAGDGGLHVIDAETGAWLWSKEGSFERPVPGFFEDMLIVHLPPDSVAAYRARNGTLLWAHSLADVGGDSGRERRVMRIVNGKAIHVRVSLPPHALSDSAVQTRLVPRARRLVCATRTGYVVCLSLDGKRLWVTPPANMAAGPARIVCDDMAGSVLATYPLSDSLVALSLADGKRRWGAVVDGLTVLDAVAAGGRVFVCAAPFREGRLDGRIECFDIRTGKQLWQCQTSRAPAGTARGNEKRSAHHGAIVVESGLIGRRGIETTVARMCLAANGGLLVAETRAVRFCVRVADASTVWTVPLGKKERRFVGPELDGHLLGSSDGTLLQMDAATGKIGRKIDLARLGATEMLRELVIEKEGQAAVRSIGRLGRPVVVKGRCLLSTESGGVLCLRIPALTAQRKKP